MKALVIFIEKNFFFEKPDNWKQKNKINVIFQRCQFTQGPITDILMKNIEMGELEIDVFCYWFFFSIFFPNENQLGFHMRYHLILHYECLLQNSGRSFIQNNMHTTVGLNVSMYLEKKTVNVFRTLTFISIYFSALWIGLHLGSAIMYAFSCPCPW